MLPVPSLLLRPLEMVDTPPQAIVATTLVDSDASTIVPTPCDTHVVTSDTVTKAIYTTGATTFGTTTSAIGIVIVVATRVYYIVDIISFCCYSSYYS